MRQPPVLAIALQLLAAAEVSAHMGSYVYPVIELPTDRLPDLHDGTLDDWEDAMEATFNQNDLTFTLDGLAEPIDPADLAVRVFLAWNHESQRIYAAVERIDDFFWAPRRGCCDFTLFLTDADHSGGQYVFPEAQYSAEERRRSNFSQAQQYLAMPDDVFDGRLVRLTDDLIWATQTPWADYGGAQSGEQPNYGFVEFYVTPWDSLNWRGADLSERGVLQAGGVIGFHVAAWDADEAGTLQDAFLLAQPAVFGSGGSHSFFAENAVDGLLVPCAQPGCSQATASSVEGDSWGRIKASLK